MFKAMILSAVLATSPVYQDPTHEPLSVAATAASSCTKITKENKMTFDRGQFRELITDTLHAFSDQIPFSDTAIELLMLTASQESGLGRYIRQTKGPALGVFQVEPNTHKNMWINVIKGKRYQFAARLLATALALPERMMLDYVTAMGESGGEAIHRSLLPQLKGNLIYQILISRLYYYMIPQGLPSNTPRALAEYWKQYYNTPLGKGTVDEAVANYAKYS